MSVAVCLLAFTTAVLGQYTPPASGGGGSTLPTRTGLLAEYLFYSGSGATQPDNSGNGHTCTLGSAAEAPVFTNQPPMAGLLFTGAVTGGRNCEIVDGAGLWSGTKTIYIAYRLNNYQTRQQAIAGLSLNTILSAVTSGEIIYFSGMNNPGVPEIYSGSLGTVPATGNTITALTFGGSPQRVYMNGQATQGYLLSSSAALGSAADIYVGDWSSHLGSAYGFNGTIAYLALYSTLDSAATIAQKTGAICATLLANGVNCYGQPPSTVHLQNDGDSMTADSQNNGFPPSYQNFLFKLLPFGVDWISYGFNGEGLDTMLANLPTNVYPNIARLQNDPNVCLLMAGTNDLAGGATAATLYANLQSYMTGTAGQGCLNVGVTILPRSGVTDGTRTTYNADMIAGFLGGSLAVNAIADVGGDPNMGQSGQYATAWYIDSAIHPGPNGNALVATYMAPAVMRAIGQGYRPVCSTVDVQNNSGTWGLIFNAGSGGTTGPGAAVTAGLTQSVPLWWISPKYKIVSTEMRTTTAFTGTTTLTATLGDSVGGGTIYSQSTPYNLQTAVGNTNFQDFTPNTSASLAGSNLVLSLTSSVNNLTSISAGVLRVTFCVASVP